MGKSRKKQTTDEMVQELITCGEDDNFDPGTLQPTDNEVQERQGEIKTLFQHIFKNCCKDLDIDPTSVSAPMDYNDVNRILQNMEEQKHVRQDIPQKEEENSGWSKIIVGCALAIGLFSIGYLAYKTFCGSDSTNDE